MIAAPAFRNSLRNMLAIAAAALLLGACQTTRLGGEMVEVKEADQPAIFSAPRSRRRIPQLQDRRPAGTQP